MSDLISREAVIKAMENNSFMVEAFGTKRKMIDGMMMCVEIADLPTVEAKEVVHGKWEECTWVEFDGIHCGVYTYPNGGLACSNCRHAFKKELLCPDNFCPNCGANMRTSAE